MHIALLLCRPSIPGPGMGLLAPPAPEQAPHHHHMGYPHKTFPQENTHFTESLIPNISVPINRNTVCVLNYISVWNCTKCYFCRSQVQIVYIWQHLCTSVLKLFSEFSRRFIIDFQLLTVFSFLFCVGMWCIHILIVFTYIMYRNHVARMSCIYNIIPYQLINSLIAD